MGKKLSLTAHPEWIITLQEFIRPEWEKILASPAVEGTAKGKLTVNQVRGWILQLYPFIHTFPKFLAETLTRIEDDYSREFFINNIRVEKEHAEHWIWMGRGFGLSRKDMLDLAGGNKLHLRDVQSLTDWLWHINTKGSIAEAVAATSYAIEGITGDIANKVIKGFEHYKNKPGVHLDDKTYRWMREHDQYDDAHPKIALEIVKRYATTPLLQKRAMIAARRSLQIFKLATDTCYYAYLPSRPSFAQRNGKNRRTIEDRRKEDKTLSFPDRRFREQRGTLVPVVA